MKLIETEHPFYKPLWRRVLIVAFCLGWAGFEYFNNAPLWALGFAAIGIYCGYMFFYAFDPQDNEDET